MRLKLVIGIAAPLVFASAPAMAFGLLGLIGSMAGLAVGTAGGAALSASGVGPAGRPGATSMSRPADSVSRGVSPGLTTGSVRPYKKNSSTKSRRHLAPAAAARALY
jgi:hypothetical protein